MNVAYSRGQRLLELASIALFMLLVAVGLWRSIPASRPYLLPLWSVAAPIGWLGADLVSGLVHWVCDSFGSARTPLIGNAFIRPFRRHHVDPEEMTRHDFVETHGASCFAALPVLAITSAMPLDAWPQIFAHAVLLCLTLGGLLSNQCHKWAHMEQGATPRLVELAQRCWLVLPREQHRLHHTPPFDTHFCMASGWLNAAFDAVLRAWR
jgi:ubiquitin-conjugating enzyme E2 variant